MKNTIPKLVVKDNALINAGYSLDLVEQRLIILSIAKARENKQLITSDTIVKIHASEYMNRFNVDQSTAYQSLKDACSNLFSRQFSYQQLSEKGNIKNVVSRWVSKIAYVQMEAIVEVCFSPDVISFISQLESHFTSYDIEQLSGLTSRYSIRMYELIIAWRSLGRTPMFEMHDLRLKLGVDPTEYTLISNFKSRVLNLSIDQINSTTDINVKCEQIKQGRVVIGFIFTFRTKTAKQLQKQNGAVQQNAPKQKIQRYPLSGLAEMNFKQLKESIPEITLNELYDIAEKDGETIEITIQRMLPLKNVLHSFLKPNLEEVEEAEITDIDTLDMFNK